MPRSHRGRSGERCTSDRRPSVRTANSGIIALETIQWHQGENGSMRIPRSSPFMPEPTLANTLVEFLVDSCEEMIVMMVLRRKRRMLGTRKSSRRVRVELPFGLNADPPRDPPRTDNHQPRPESNAYITDQKMFEKVISGIFFKFRLSEVFIFVVCTPSCHCRRGRDASRSSRIPFYAVVDFAVTFHAHRPLHSRSEGILTDLQ